MRSATLEATPPAEVRQDVGWAVPTELFILTAKIAKETPKGRRLLRPNFILAQSRGPEKKYLWERLPTAMGRNYLI